jgi:hypothetical protein
VEPAALVGKESVESWRCLRRIESAAGLRPVGKVQTEAESQRIDTSRSGTGTVKASWWRQRKCKRGKRRAGRLITIAFGMKLECRLG